MHEIDLDNLPRRKTYDWFNSFNNPTYGLTVKLDVTSLVEHTKKHNESFFINMLYIVVKALNSVDNLRMRFENNEPVLDEDGHEIKVPAFDAYQVVILQALEPIFKQGILNDDSELKRFD